MKNADLKRLYGKDNMPNKNGFARLNEKGELDNPISSDSIVTPEGTPAGKILSATGNGGTQWVDDAGGTVVVANPTLSGGETVLDGIEIDGTKYNVSDVKPNPTLAGTESALEGVQIDGTKYKIEGGVKSVNGQTGNVVLNMNAPGVQYTTVAPTGPNTDGYLKFVVLDAEPANKYAGYIYLIQDNR